MALIIKGRISYTPDDGGPVLDLTTYSHDGAAPPLSWKDEKDFSEWVQRRIKVLQENEIDTGQDYGGR